MNPICVVIIAKNCEEFIRECLESLHLFDDVILYLNTIVSFFIALYTLDIIYEKSDINAIVLPDESLLFNN